MLAGFANSADLGGIPLPDGREIPRGRLLRSNTPESLTDDELAAAQSFGFATVLDLRSEEERRTSPHPCAQLRGYRSLPLIDPAAEAREDFSRYATLGDIYSSSLQRNATHIGAIFAALASTPPGPVLVSCRAGKDRTGMVVAVLLDLVGVDRKVIAADYTARHDGPGAADEAKQGRDAADILQMLEHITAAYGSTSRYLRRVGLDSAAIQRLQRRLLP